MYAHCVAVTWMQKIKGQGRTGPKIAWKTGGSIIGIGIVWFMSLSINYTCRSFGDDFTGHITQPTASQH